MLVCNVSSIQKPILISAGLLLSEIERLFIIGSQAHVKQSYIFVRFIFIIRIKN